MYLYRIKNSIFILLFLFSVQSCGSSECKGAIFNLGISVVTNVAHVFTGESVNFECIVRNVTNTIDACKDDEGTTPSNAGQLIVEFSSEEEGEYQMISSQIIEIPSILEDEIHKDNFNLTFQESGFYKVTMKCNTEEDFEESTLDDNQSTVFMIVQ